MRIITAGVLVLIGAFAAPLAVAQSQQRLTFADDEALEISVASDAKSATETVVVVNSGPAISELTFAAISEKADAAKITVTAPDGSAVAANEAARVTLSFKSDDSLKGFSGHLTAAAQGAVAERDLKIDAKNELPFSVNLVIFGSLALAAGLTAVRALTLHDRLGYRLSKPGWDFSKSWASTFTVVGALLGTVLASSALPASPERFSKETLAGMNLLFAVAILVAPLLFSASEKRQVVTANDASEIQGQGTVAGYLLACALTLAGVLGQLATVFFLLSEIEAKGALTKQALYYLSALLVVAAVVVLIYASRTMGWTAENATPPTDPDQPRIPEEPAFRPSLL